jgi:hypothetical protein
MMVFNPPPNWPVPPRGWSPRPGWQPDPTWGPPPPGWKLWVDENAGQGKTVNSAPKKKPHVFRVMVLLFIGLVIVAIWQGGAIGEISLGGNDGVSVKMNKAEVQANQPALEDRLERIESNLQERSPEATATIDISGSWRGENGFDYFFEQFGDTFTFSEESSYGLTATGQGTINGDRLRLTFEAWNESTGRAEMVLAGNGVLSGTVTNDTYQVSDYLSMSRTGE